MLKLNYYFLREIERIQIEQFLLTSFSGMTEEEVQSLDDRELMSVYNERQLALSAH